ncbi:uncharacterized protein K489DRAFT_373022 [Dissoconium aciculare CBS 342.82]|uniref:AA1-like domain-containing protein n=1 Tax=Dissoconium aciculare CBS 342.82 TaxID=1314786 RepID=A0A6J3LYR9_9PEZI|nr:uncharacterized protein K489DRAFT_373022 [Dissoconium aciculare CBS 342.82]KAF1819782.1 hypothetical protein K489DRAFT_373022 [Dissoconium aciculare CBS 342.82]
MKTTTMLATLVALAATVSASPLKRAVLFTGKAYEITNLKLEDVSRGNVSINFNVHDPDPLTDATGTCSGSWPHGSEPRDTFHQRSVSLTTLHQVACDQGFTWNFESYTNFQNFTLRATHSFRDPSVGEPPYDSVRTYAHAHVDTGVISCDIFGGDINCRQNEGTVIKAPIYAAVA